MSERRVDESFSDSPVNLDNNWISLKHVTSWIVIGIRGLENWKLREDTTGKEATGV